MKAILYARVSTDDQTVRMQIAGMREFCKRKGWVVVDEVKETGSGAKARPERQAILNRAARGVGPGFDALVVWKLDRWGRSTPDLLVTINELRERGVDFVSVTEGLDFSTPAGRALAGMLAVFAQFEREIIQERVNTGIQRYREKHGKWGRPAAARAASGLVKLLRKEGKSYSQIAKASGMSESSVYRILKGEA